MSAARSVQAKTSAEEKPSPVDAMRAFGVMLGGPIVLVGAAVTSVGFVLRALARRRRPNPLALGGTAASALYVTIVHPRLMRWGATDEEVEKALPGDEFVPVAGMQATRAVTIDAPVEEVWPWLAQLGQDRAGFYSYEWLENLAGCRMRNANRLDPEWQTRGVGETVKLHWASGLKLTRFEPPRVYALGGWYIVLEPNDGRTRLFARSRFPRGLASLAYGLLLELPHFIMERKMLLGIQECAGRRGIDANATSPVA
jgi:hypothetical protein